MKIEIESKPSEVRECFKGNITIRQKQYDFSIYDDGNSCWVIWDDETPELAGMKENEIIKQYQKQR